MARGFQSRETSGAIVTIYAQGDDPILRGRPGALPIDGDGRPGATSPSLISVSTSKVLGQPAGTFEVELKTRDPDFLDKVMDDDWVDISFTRGARVYATMRGLIDSIQRVESVNEQDATDVTYTISGRDFGKCFERTEIYFNRFLAEGLGGVTRIFAAADPNLFGDVRKTVETFLLYFLTDLSNTTGATSWRVASGMPGLPDNELLAKVLQFPRSGGWSYGQGYTNNPPRVSFLPAFMDPQGSNLWSLAQQWSDPGFCELYTELTKADGTIPSVEEAEELRFEDSAMSVILRDRPFPFGDNPRNDSFWFDLPTLEITRQDIEGVLAMTRGGEERFNAFFVKGKAFAEAAGNNIELVAPLVDLQSVRKHGFRRFDITTEYVPDPDSRWPEFITRQRALARDWHMLNPYLLSGNITLARGFPELRIGTRLRIAAGEHGQPEETYYTEGVYHSWSQYAGMKTSASLTRGWRGDEQSFLSTMREMRKQYALIDGPADAPSIISTDGSFAQTGSTIV